MTTTPMKKTRLAAAVAGAAVAGMLSGSLAAAEFSFNNGEINGRFDTLFSAGALFRTQSQSRMLAANEDVLAMAAGGYSTQLNKNDANNNFDTGLASMVYKITPELLVNVGNNWGFFARATAFYDSVIMDSGHDGGLLDPLVPPDPVLGPGGVYNRYATASDYANNGAGSRFNDQARSNAGRKFRMLDAYVFADMDFLDRPLNVRLGQQVISWGEALFIQGGVNTANYVDLAALRLPGSEIKEALLPMDSIYFNWGVTDNLTLETFYQFEWKNSLDSPVGTFYSTHDAFPGKGADNVIVDGRLVQASAFGQLGLLPIGDTFANYTEAQYGSLSDPSGYDYEATQVTINRMADQRAKDSGQFGLAGRYFAPALNGAEIGVFYTRTHARLPVVGARLTNYESQLGGGLGAIPEIIDNTQYQMVYLEDVDMFGLTVATTVGDVSLSAEVAYRPKQPIINEVGDNLIASLAGASLPAALGGTAPTVSDLTKHCVRDEIGGSCLDASTPVDGTKTYYFYDEAETITASLVSIFSFGPALGTDSLLLLLELGMDNTSGLNSRDQDGNKLYYNSTAAISLTEAQIQTPNDIYKTYLTQTAWGYRAVLQSEFNDAFAGVTMRPSIRFAHDVQGNSPIGGNFLEDRQALTLGVDFIYLNNLEVGVQNTSFWGNSYSNKLSDRNNASIALKYSF